MHLTRRSLDFSGAVQCLWKKPDAARGFSTGVSLHGHTAHSQEYFDFIPRVFAELPMGSGFLRILDKRRQRRAGLNISYCRAFWRPPLAAHGAHDLEAAQIRDTLGLNPIVALTDHDNLEACADLRAIGMPVPYSLEWTVPFAGTVFHLGIFNLPSEIGRASCR